MGNVQAEVDAGTRGPATWEGLPDEVEIAVGPLPAGWRAQWRAELAAVRSRVGRLERTEPPPGHAPAGLHALVTIATVRRSARWVPGHLIDAAAAIELAYRATLHHAGVVDDSPAARGTPGSGSQNRARILDGDWAITQAAVLVAAISPQAYREVVRGYGGAQLTGLHAHAWPEPPGSSVGPAGGEPPQLPLIAAAQRLGLLLAGNGRGASRTCTEMVGAVVSWAARQADPDVSPDVGTFRRAPAQSGQ